MKSYLMVSVSLACTVACGQAALAQPPRELRPGTYALRLCRVTCDPRYPKNTFRSGWIVLGDAPVDLSNLPDSVRKWLELSYIMMADPRASEWLFSFHVESARGRNVRRARRTTSLAARRYTRFSQLPALSVA